uniref:Uncharacterized protein n=1 Tax=Schistosoma haematobium TaxID=6185 RepID=A0A095ANL9_SCHHA
MLNSVESSALEINATSFNHQDVVQCSTLSKCSHSVTFEYVCHELVQIPPKLPILIVSNFHDIQEQRKITEEQVQMFLNDSIMQSNQYNVTSDEKFNELSRNIYVQNVYHHVYCGLSIGKLSVNDLLFL